MKVIHCIGRLKSGGAETQLNILINQKNEGLQNIVVSYDNREADTNTSYYQIDYSKSIFKKWKAFYSICKKENPDIIHIWLPSVLYVYAIPSLFVSSKKLFAIRNIYRLDSLINFISFFLFGLSKNVVSNSPLNCHSGAFGYIFSKKNYTFIPNAIKYEVDEIQKLNASRREQEKFQFLYVGRLVEQKNIPVLLKALAQLPLKNWELSIVGQGEEGLELQKLTKNLGIADKVFFIDFTDDVESYYQKADVLVLPSFIEGMPNVAFEALVFDTVLILSDIVPHQTWFTDRVNAYLFPPNDVGALVECLVQSMEMAEDIKNEFNSRNKKILESLTKEKYFENYMKLYTQLIR